MNFFGATIVLPKWSKMILYMFMVISLLLVIVVGLSFSLKLNNKIIKQILKRIDVLLIILSFIYILLCSSYIYGYDIHKLKVSNVKNLHEIFVVVNTLILSIDYLLIIKMLFGPIYKKIGCKFYIYINDRKLIINETLKDGTIVLFDEEKKSSISMGLMLTG
jgi:hypothetical protein